MWYLSYRSYKFQGVNHASTANCILGGRTFMHTDIMSGITVWTYKNKNFEISRKLRWYNQSHELIVTSCLIWVLVICLKQVTSGICSEKISHYFLHNDEFMISQSNMYLETKCRAFIHILRRMKVCNVLLGELIFRCYATLLFEWLLIECFNELNGSKYFCIQ